MNKRVIILMLLMIVTFTFPSYLSPNVDYVSEADILNAYGLFSGTNTGYDLERIPSRVEAAAMLVKLLGKEEEAKLKHYSHPFKDVPTWANDAIGFMYANKMTTGISAEMFGAKQSIKAKDFIVFALKALGYSGGDFEYSDTWGFAEKVGLLETSEITELQSNEFKRDEMVHVSFKAINTNYKDDSITLLETLSKEGVLNTVAQESTSTVEAFLVGKTTRYEETFKINITTSGTFSIESDALSVKASKAQTIYKNEDFNIYEGEIAFNYGFKQWDKEDIYYEIIFYNKGRLVKTYDKVIFGYNGLIDGILKTEFETPMDAFDSVKIVAYPDKLRSYDDDMVIVLSSSETDKIVELIKAYDEMSWTSMGMDILGATDKTSLLLKLPSFTSGGTHYPDETHYNGDASVIPHIEGLEHKLTFKSYCSVSVNESNPEAKFIDVRLKTTEFKDTASFVTLRKHGSELIKVLMVTND